MKNKEQFIDGDHFTHGLILKQNVFKKSIFFWNLVRANSIHAEDL